MNQSNEDSAQKTRIAALIKALKHSHWNVRERASEVLGKIGLPAVPALIEALKDSDTFVRWRASEALGKIGDSETLPRKILASRMMSVNNKIVALNKARNKQYTFQGQTFSYDFPEVSKLCRLVIDEQDIEAKEGAEAVLGWLNGDRYLLQASDRDYSTESQELLRGFEGGAIEIHPETLLQASAEPENGSQKPLIKRSIFDWFREK